MIEWCYYDNARTKRYNLNEGEWDKLDYCIDGNVKKATCCRDVEPVPCDTYSSKTDCENAGCTWEETIESYPVEICYEDIFGQQGDGNRECTGKNKVLGLSSETNAHL